MDIKVAAYTVPQKLGKICTLVTTREAEGNFLNKLELMNGCISKAHSNLFIPSTLTGSNKGEKRLDEEKIKEIWKLQHTHTSVMYKEPLVLEQI